MLLDFNQFFQDYCPDMNLSDGIAVGVSGGADSLALAHALSGWMKGRGSVHCLTVDHQLRENSAQEAAHVAGVVRNWGEHVSHEILRWNSQNVESSIQEKARNARLSLMSEYCQENHIGCLVLAHHADDQVETFLIRLTAGSGPDGLACMQGVTDREGLKILRPLLSLSHKDCISYCKAHYLDWVEDPSNENEGFERVRFRKSMEILEAEGLTKGRLLKSIERFQNTREIVDFTVEKEFSHCLKERDTQHIVFYIDRLLALPKALAHHILRATIKELGEDTNYGPRMLKSEELTEVLFLEKEHFKKRTLGGCLFSVSKDGKCLLLEKEKQD